MKCFSMFIKKGLYLMRSFIKLREGRIERKNALNYLLLTYEDIGYQNCDSGKEYKTHDENKIQDDMNEN